LLSQSTAQLIKGKEREGGEKGSEGEEKEGKERKRKGREGKGREGKGRSKAQILLLCTHPSPLAEKECCLLTITEQSLQQ